MYGINAGLFQQVIQEMADGISPLRQGLPIQRLTLYQVAQVPFQACIKDWDIRVFLIQNQTPTIGTVLFINTNLPRYLVVFWGENKTMLLI